MLDDVQWADEALWPLLTRIQPLLNQLPLLIILSGRSGALQEWEPALDAISAWERDGAPVIVLPPLTAEELRRLAADTAQSTLNDAELAALQVGSGGNPLLALALLNAADLASVAKRTDLSDLIQRRLAHLSQPAQLALQAAAVLGFQFDYGQWAAVAPDVLSDSLPLLAGELEQRRMLLLDGAAYRFDHDTLRAHVYATTPAARRRQLHQRALNALRAETSTPALALLRHAQGLGQTQRSRATRCRPAANRCAPLLLRPRKPSLRWRWRRYRPVRCSSAGGRSPAA
jgi:predicted ATPase